MEEKEPRIPGERGPLQDDDNQPVARFSLGQVVGTPGALKAIGEAGQSHDEFLFRHVTGDWGDLCDEDRAENELSVEKGYRILSAYKLHNGVKVWVITEWDRSATTILLPSEY